MKDEQGIIDLVNSWLDDDEDIRYRDADEVASEYADTIMASEDLENYGYTDEDRDEIYDIVSEAVNSYMDEVSDIYALAENWDGNMATDKLGEDEWEEIYNNAPDVYIEALHSREEFVVNNFEWASIPDHVWEYIEDCVRNNIGFTSPEPEVVIDNIIVNGSYGDFDEFKDEDQSDEDFIAEREEEGDYIDIFPEDRFIIYSL